MSQQRPANERAARILLYACFAGSGAAGLILEIVWSKYLSLLLGNSIYAISTVVAAFLGGLGIGAWWGGRLAPRTREPLLLYARLEIVVGLLGLVSPLGYLAARPVFAWLYQSLGGGGAAFHALRLAVLFVALLPPTVAMGASLPLLAADFTRRGAAFAPAVGRLYAWNTFGAVGGVVAAGFVLIPMSGLWRTAVLAALVDFAVAAVVILRRPPPAAVPALDSGGAATERSGAGHEPAIPGPASAPPVPAAVSRAILPLFAVSGFTAILYEIAWTRILSVPFGGMVYALSAILALYLLGIAAGAALATAVMKAARAPILLFGVFEVLLAATTAMGGHVFGRIPFWQAQLAASSEGGPWRLLAGDAAITALIVLPPTLMLGALFPVAAAVYQRRRLDAGPSVGAVYAANTAGSIAGSIATGFLLLPAIGAMRAILAAAAVNLAIGLFALWFAERRRVGRIVGASAAALGVLFAVFALPQWQAQRMSIGLTRFLRLARPAPGSQAGGDVASRFVATSGTPEGEEQLRFYKEGRVATVAVVETPGRTTLIVNGKPDASTGAEGEDMATQVGLGQIPLLFAPRAKSVCVVGYGSGMTTHSVLTHPVDAVLTVELEQAVLDAAPLFREARAPLSDPRSSVLVEDAGTFLRSTPRRFDVIISEPSNPWIAGVGDLFTADFYRLAAARLTPGGVFCQWVQAYELSPRTLWTILRTLRRAFPHGQVFYFASSSDFVIVASPDRELVMDPRVMAEAFSRPEVAEDFARVGITSFADLLRHYRGRLESVTRGIGEEPINTDDNGLLEHSAPLDLIAQPSSKELLARSPEVPKDLVESLGRDADAAAALLKDAATSALGRKDGASARRFARALESMHRPEAAEVWPRIAELARSRDDLVEAEKILNEAAPLAVQAAQSRDPAGTARAVEMLSRAAQLDPQSREIAWRLGAVLILAGHAPEAERELKRSLALAAPPDPFPIRRDLVRALFAQDRWDEAQRELDELDELRSGAPEVRYWRARLFFAKGERDAARREMEDGLRDHPGNPQLLSLRDVFAGSFDGSGSKP